MLEVNRNENIELLTHSEVKSIEGYVGNYNVTVEMKPRYTTDECNGCGACTEVCPVYTTNYFDEYLGARRAIDISFGQAVPFLYDVDRNTCIE
ncbi:MAG: 4Fe-4S dicluster domain-containing protein [Candidatus Hodarchaeota archaeon]